MKNLTITFILLLIMVAGTSFGQGLEKGNLLGIHTLTVQLDPDATMNQYKNYMLEKVIPGWEENSDMKVYLLQGMRGENENSLGIMFFFKSDADRDKYWNADGTPTELQTKLGEKMQAINEEAAKLGTWTSEYTDWIVQ